MAITHSPAYAHTGQVGWTRDLARDLFSGRVLPFTWTLLVNPAEAGLRTAYLELGAPAHAIAGPWWRLQQGLAYLHREAVESADRALAGAAWLGPRRPAAPDGLIARLQSGSLIKRCQARLAAVPAEARSTQARLLKWLSFVRGLRWTQADLLQVMEELEPNAHAALKTYFLARMGLNAADWALQARLAGWLPGDGAGQIAGLYGGVEGMPSAAMAEAVARAAARPQADPERSAALIPWRHRGPGEMRPDARRWDAAPDLLARLAGREAPRWTQARAAEQRGLALAGLRGRLSAERHRELERSLGQVHEMIVAADVAWDALAAVMAVAQHWAAAAAGEALAAGLIAAPEDVLYLELEELKQVATGEWHAGRSAAAQQAVGLRKAEAAEARAVEAPAAGSPRPVVLYPGAESGPLYRVALAAEPPPGALWYAETIDPGWAPLWGDAAGLLCSAADPWAPGCIAARALGVPTTIAAPAP